MYYFAVFYVLFYKWTVFSIQEKIALTRTKILFLPEFDLTGTLLYSNIRQFELFHQVITIII